MAQSLAAMRKALPIIARHEGVWEGIYRRYDAQGQSIGMHRSRVVMRLRPEAANDEFYDQTNIYYHPDGRTEVIQTKGVFDGERLRFYSDRVDGWSKDDITDPENRSCMLFMIFKQDIGWYTAGVQVYELINISDCDRYRTRMTQHLKDGRTLTRTLIDETRRTRDWREHADWALQPVTW
ncbi:MAG: hypothetical protein SFV19_14185 [Rhodospirillaceae bacterium]|nr:hypothetical protein [Rhodospirillaceae bacterium]